ncbi:MAG TPA: hypothetical protein VFO84_06785 [Dehalococcoidia bacterium]|nr:hypothetical protein [Dehalococcoidia bacterium]
MSLEEPPPAASTEWRGIWFGVCVAIIIASALLLTDAMEAVPASIVGIFSGIASGVIFQRFLQRHGES